MLSVIALLDPLAVHAIQDLQEMVETAQVRKIKVHKVKVEKIVLFKMIVCIQLQI